MSSTSIDDDKWVPTTRKIATVLNGLANGQLLSTPVMKTTVGISTKSLERWGNHPSIAGYRAKLMRKNALLWGNLETITRFRQVSKEVLG